MKQILQLIHSIIQRLLLPGAVEQDCFLHQPAFRYVYQPFFKNK
jgi:hypothetical protein